MEWETIKLGETRERLKFAWYPMDCEDGITRWLCKVRVVEIKMDIGYRILKVYRAEVEIQR